MLRGNPRKNGHTQRLTDTLVQGMRSEGGDVTDIDLCSKNINQCIGCFKCWYVHKGGCIFDDDMPGIIEELYRSDLIFVSTPLYYFTMSPYLATFFNRLLPVTGNGFMINNSKNLTNRPTDPSRWHGKKFAYISCAGFRGMKIFKGLKSTMRLISDGLMTDLCCEILRPESYLLPFYFAAPATITRINNSLELAGRQLVRNGYVEEDVLDGIKTPLIDSDKEYMELSNYYTHHAERLGHCSSDIDKISDSVMRDTGFLMKKLERYTDPKATANVEAVIRFEFPDKNELWSVCIDKGKTMVYDHATESEPRLSVTVESSVWASVFLGEIDAKSAIMDGSIVLKGEKNLFMKFPRFFPPPNG